jgi:Sigma-70 region 2
MSVTMSDTCRIVKSRSVPRISIPNQLGKDEPFAFERNAHRRSRTLIFCQSSEALRRLISRRRKNYPHLAPPEDFCPLLLFGGFLWMRLTMTTSQQLLAEYRAHGSEAAFQELVNRYTDLVYSTALRLVGGDTHRAEDVAQTVFVDLARQARKLSAQTMLGGWLYRDTCFAAAKAMRGERRRQAREQEAVRMNAQERPFSSQLRASCARAG